MTLASDPPKLCSFLPCTGSSGGSSSTLNCQFRGFKLGRRLPEPLKIVILSRVLGKNVDDEIHIVEQHPLRLFITFFVCDTDPYGFQTLVDSVGDCLDLPRVRPCAHDKVVGEGSRVFLQFEDRDLFSFLVLTSKDGFIDLAFEGGCFLHK